MLRKLVNIADSLKNFPILVLRLLMYTSGWSGSSGNLSFNKSLYIHIMRVANVICIMDMVVTGL